MKLAEALLERKNLRQKIDAIRSRAVQSALVQEGDEPAENSVELLRELGTAISDWGLLVRRINGTNNVVKLDSGDTLSDAIVRRDELDLRRVALDAVLNHATLRQNRLARNEIKFVPVVNVTELRREADAVAKARRELDAQIQAANWNFELLD